MEERVAALEGRIFDIEANVTNTSQKVGAKTLSIKEYILAKRPIDDNQKILAIAYFLEQYDGLSSFNAKDLADGFSKAKEKAPANINDRANKIINKTGYLMEAKEKKDNLKAWLLTNSGEYFVSNNMPNG